MGHKHIQTLGLGKPLACLVFSLLMGLTFLASQVQAQGTEQEISIFQAK